MATIKKRGKSWFAQVRRKGISKSASFKTKAAAQDWANLTETEILQGKFSVSYEKTLKDALVKYSEEVSPTKKGHKWEVGRCDLLGRIIPFSGQHIDKVTIPMLAQWRDDRLKQVGNNSVRRELSLLASVFEQARREWQWITTNPLKEVKPPPMPKHRERIFTGQEIEKILSALGDSPTYYATIIAYETGMRRGEIAGLQWSEINLDRSFCTLLDTKNGTRRDVALSSKAVDTLRKLQHWDKPIQTSAENITIQFYRACKKAGVTGGTFHDLRHTAITQLAKKLKPFELARLVGHKDMSMTLRYYNESAEEIAKKLG